MDVNGNASIVKEKALKIRKMRKNVTDKLN